MKTRCLITCGNEVIVLGIRSLLREQEDIDYIDVRVGQITDLKLIVDQIRPDVLLIDRQEINDPNLTCLLPYTEFPDLVVIILEMEKNLIQIYRRGEMKRTSSADLLTAIRSQRGFLYEE